MDSAFDELMPGGVTVSTGNPTRDIYGVETWSTGGSTYLARYAPKAETHRTRDGRVFEQVGVVWVDSTTPFSTQARVTLSSGAAPPVFAVEVWPDENGMHHQKLRLGWQG